MRAARENWKKAIAAIKRRNAKLPRKKQNQTDK